MTDHVKCPCGAPAAFPFELCSHCLGERRRVGPLDVLYERLRQRGELKRAADVEAAVKAVSGAPRCTRASRGRAS